MLKHKCVKNFVAAAAVNKNAADVAVAFGVDAAATDVDV
uniref:Uncharacterized protein n=1 Tax=Romanomermis culicivorax TaxID=13658 RepID=A0A915IYN6_ROMCU